jgi:hypothetical protein
VNVPIEADELLRLAVPLLSAAGFGAPVGLESLPGGGNNRVYRLTGVGGVALLKSYFRHPEDLRDRLGAEYRFSEYAWGLGVRSLPRPLACDREHAVGLYEYIPGIKLAAGEVEAAHVREAGLFLAALNQNRLSAAASALPMASEACFSIESHLECVDRRTARLQQIDADSPGGRRAAALVKRLLPQWHRIREKVVSTARAAGSSTAAVLPQAERCLSPSDFGFHNAIAVAEKISGDRRLRFIDFEYAGWDDPAKTVCDFFCQPAVPVPRGYLEAFVEQVADCVPDAAGFCRRVGILLPVYEVKWCCIMLNEFLPVGSRRRFFARSEEDSLQRQGMQLDKVEAAVSRLEKPSQA